MGAFCTKRTRHFSPQKARGTVTEHLLQQQGVGSGQGAPARADGRRAWGGTLLHGHRGAAAPVGRWRRRLRNCEPCEVLEEAVCPRHGSDLPAPQLGPRSPVLHLSPGRGATKRGGRGRVLLVRLQGAARSRGWAAGLSREAAGFQKLKANQNGQKAWKAGKNYK